MKRGPQPEYARFRISKIEIHIARCSAKRDYNAEEELRYFAKEIGIRLNETNISEHKEQFEKVLESWRNDTK